MPPAASAPAGYTTVVETNDGRAFFVRDAGSSNLAHVFDAVPAKRARGGYVVAKGAPRLIRRVGCALLAEVA